MQYEQDNDVVLAVKKLIILMPRSCYIEPELGVSGDEDLELANHMNELKISRAGTRERKYTNTVYKIRNGDNSPFSRLPAASSRASLVSYGCPNILVPVHRPQLLGFGLKLRRDCPAKTLLQSQLFKCSINQSSVHRQPRRAANTTGCVDDNCIDLCAPRRPFTDVEFDARSVRLFQNYHADLTAMPRAAERVVLFTQPVERIEEALSGSHD
ncbi:hypothetical protein HPB51_012355 [Rhipicephalus microplus]|uniref:STING ligand-binding domain-containing protein n=1 Tax=Rhipicephalus microplus TaxID=6941 RepID=A0A9J6DG65_RHIMP|nr:hypothetical protein HPB51_012355 [Rhipicephalus microplus]